VYYSAYSTVGDVTSLHRDAGFSRRKPGSFDMMLLVRVGFSSKLQIGFNCSLVPNVAKNMADLINIKQMYVYSLLSGRLGHLKGG
jgi:phage gp37-like protein